MSELVLVVLVGVVCLFLGWFVLPQPEWARSIWSKVTGR